MVRKTSWWKVVIAQCHEINTMSLIKLQQINVVMN